MKAVNGEGDLGIGIRVRWLIAIGIAGLLLFAVMAFVTIREVRFGSTAFAQNRIAHDIDRDFVAPSQSLLSAYAFYRQCRAAHGRADIEQAWQTLRQAHTSLEEGHRFYLQAMPPGPLRELITVDSYQSAEQWYRIVESEYMPWIEKGDLDQAENVRIDKLEALVRRNSASNAEIDSLNSRWIAANEKYVEKEIWSRSTLLAVVGMLTLALQLLLGMMIHRRVGISTGQLQATLEELRNKNREIEAFVYIVSHDLRAPLVNLQGFVCELEESCKRLRQTVQSCPQGACCAPCVLPILNEDIGGALHFITASAAKFERLIAALLAFSRQGRQVYRLERVNVWELVTATVATFQQTIGEIEAEVVVGHLPAVTADATALGQVFANLIGNALKYRDLERPLKIEVGGRLVEQTAHFWVRDNGVGVPESGKSRLFQVFQRLHSGKADGEGMGLAIVHRIVERHGGKIWADSREGEGTTFHFSLPLIPVAAPKIHSGGKINGPDAIVV